MTGSKTQNISSIPIDAFSNLRVTSLWTFLQTVSVSLDVSRQCVFEQSNCLGQWLKIICFDVWCQTETTYNRFLYHFTFLDPVD